MNAYSKHHRKIEQNKEVTDLVDCLTLASNGLHSSESEHEVYDLESEEDIIIPPTAPTVCTNVRPRSGRVTSEIEERK